jgi:uncharacterized repeat protein (TIGR01451 family)
MNNFIKQLLFTIALVFGSNFLYAQSITPFTIWKQVTQRGDVTFTGNTTLTCNGGALCNTGRTAVSPTGNGGGNNFNNNGFTMIYNNIADATDPVTRFSRTSANLTLGTTGGCGVIYAELFWGGSINAGTVNQAKRDSVYFRTPVGGYTGLKADLLTNSAIPFGGYYCYKDVTNLVRQGGTGTYWLANQVAQTGATGLCGGWTLVVIYGDPTLPLRNLTIFRGISAINAANPQNIPISGFFTPPSPAAVNLKLGVFSLEGDRGTVGDSLKFNGNPGFGFLSVSDTKNPIDNAFNSTINNNTAEITRVPNFPNTLGIDEDIFVPNNTTYNYLLNSATSATIRMTSSGDVFAPFMISTAIDVFEPNIEITKEVLDINGGLVELGDTLKFDLKVVNKGNDPATNVILHDSLYGAMDYVPGSLKINTGANTGVKTDVAGDDQAEFALSGGVNFVKFRLGSGANSTTGGNMGITAATDSLTTMEFKVTVTTDCQIFHCNSNIVNKAFVTFVGNISGASRSTYSSPTGLDEYGCPAIGPTTLVVNVPPCTPPADTSITACSPYPLSTILPFRPGYNQYYNSIWATVTEATSTGTYYAIKQLYPGCNDTIQINMSMPCTLPVILSYFKGEYNNNAVKLYWKIETQSGFSHFEIDRSTDGRNFSTIGNVALSGIDLYNFLDVNLVSGSIYYYRLKMIDTDGNFKYSNIVVVRMNGGKNQINIYPNPASDFVNAELGSNAKGDYSLQLIDATGRTVNTKIVTNAQSNQLITIQSGGLASGVYILKIVSRHYNETTLSKVIFK